MSSTNTFQAKGKRLSNLVIYRVGRFYENKVMETSGLTIKNEGHLAE